MSWWADAIKNASTSSWLFTAKMRTGMGGIAMGAGRKSTWGSMGSMMRRGAVGGAIVGGTYGMFDELLTGENRTSVIGGTFRGAMIGGVAGGTFNVMSNRGSWFGKKGMLGPMNMAEKKAYAKFKRGL